MTDLKPCPFCGNSVDVVLEYAECRGCEFSESISIWNSRPIEDAKDATIERMRGLLGEALPNMRDHAAGYLALGNIQEHVREIVSRIEAELKEGE